MVGKSLFASEYARAVLKRFSILLVPLLSLFLVIILTHYYTDRKLELVRHEADETLIVDLAQTVINKELHAVATDLLFLSHLNELKALLNRTNPQQTRLLAQEFIKFSQFKTRYDQIRYIDVNGNERVRVNYNNGEPYVTQQTKLQSKAARYYFKESIKLGQGKIYVSPFDLNMEHGKLEYPLKPVIRFATPLIDSSGEKQGILILNYLGNNLTQSFRQAVTNVAGHIYLVNSQGYWLSAQRRKDEWGFMLAHKRSFSNDYPEAWKLMLNRDAGQFYVNGYLYSFTTIHPKAIASNGSSHPERFWKIISIVSPIMLSQQSQGFYRRHFSLYFFVGIFFVMAAAALAFTGVKQRITKARHEYDKRFRNTLETIHLAAITLDANGAVSFCNDYLLKQTGWSREDVIGQHWISSFVAEDREKTQSILSEFATLDSFPTNYENLILTKDGKTRLFFWNNSRFHDAANEVVSLTCIGEDITERRMTEEKVHKLSRAVEQSPNPVIITDTNGIIEYVNPKFTENAGYTYDEVIGQLPSILKSGETSQDDYEKLWDTIMKGGEWNGLFHNKRKNGELYWEYTSISPIRDSNGNITHFLAVKEDVTERKRLEEEVEARTRELAQSQALAVVGKMSNMIAHDLRNPLSSIKMGLQILGKRPAIKSKDWEAQAEELKQISLDQVRYMEEILSDLLQFSRPDILKPNWINIDKLLDITISSTEKAIKHYHAKLTTEYEPQLPTIFGDATKLRQVFSNLILNALQATENVTTNPEILIRAKMTLQDTRPVVQIDLCDNGLGVSPDQVEKMFEPFYTTRAKGTGLGLAIVKRIIDQHQGKIELTPRPAGGTCTTVILPTGNLYQQ